VYEWTVIIIKNFVAIDGHHNEASVTNATGCNPQKQIIKFIHEYVGNVFLGIVVEFLRGRGFSV
jgi:hypothetical protein